MYTANVWKDRGRRCSAWLVFLSLWLISPAVWAAHEVDKGDITADVELNKLTKWTDNLVVRWKAPSMGADILNGYFYKWSDSISTLNATDGLFTDFSAAVDGTVATELDPPNVVKDKASLASLDSGNVLYLHIITYYLDMTINVGQQRVSADTVYGPFLIDNKAPVGTVRIVDGAGNDISTTSDTKLNLEFSAAKDPVTMYLSETGNKPVTGTAYVSSLVWDLSDTTAGLKTISAWFEDSVGNLSQIATDSVTLLAATNISPNTATIDLAASATQTFRVEGTDAAYTWSIINPSPETSGATVAQITSGSAAANSVTVQGLAKGTFKLQADPDTSAAGDELTSGTISVVETTKTANISLAVGWNLISIPYQPANTSIATLLSGIAGKYSIVWGEFNPATSAWKNYNPAKQTNSLTAMEPNKGYWVKVTEACTLSATGAIVTSKGGSLASGWNLIGFAGDVDTAITTVLAGISGKYSIVWGEFNPATSAWKNYNPAKQTNSLNTMGAGKGYWIKASESCSLSY